MNDSWSSKVWGRNGNEELFFKIKRGNVLRKLSG
jgi:hypothetical protein